MDFSKLKALLDDQHVFPEVYQFKFICPQEKVEELKALLEVTETFERPSKTGKYTGVTVKILVDSSDQVIEIYKKAGSIAGVMTL